MAVNKGNKVKIQSHQKRTILLVGLLHLMVIAGLALNIKNWGQLSPKKLAGTLKEKVEEKTKGEHQVVKGSLVPVDSFLVNILDNQGKIANVNMEFEVNNSIVRNEIDERKSQIRDIIIILLSNKKYEEFLTKQGKDILKSEIRDTVNSFLTKGRINQIYFKEFALN